MGVRRAFHLIKTVIYILILLILLTFIMFLFNDYSAQIPFKLILSVIIIELAAFQICGRFAEIQFEEDRIIAHADKEFEVSININKRVPYPFKKLEVYIQYKNHYWDEYKKKRIVIELNDKKRQRERVKFKLADCGCVDFIIQYAVIYDIFAMSGIRLKKCEGSRSGVVIMPEIKSVDIDSDHIKTVSVEDMEEYEMNGYGNHDDERYEVREFRDGDGLNRIHWKLSSKQGELMVRDNSAGNNFGMNVFFDLCHQQNLNEMYEETVSICYELLRRQNVFYILWMEYDVRTSAYHFIRIRINDEHKLLETISEIMRCDLYDMSDTVRSKLNLVKDREGKTARLFMCVKN